MSPIVETDASEELLKPLVWAKAVPIGIHLSQITAGPFERAGNHVRINELQKGLVRVRTLAAGS